MHPSHQCTLSQPSDRLQQNIRKISFLCKLKNQLNKRLERRLPRCGEDGYTRGALSQDPLTRYAHAYIWTLACIAPYRHVLSAPLGDTACLPYFCGRQPRRKCACYTYSVDGMSSSTNS